MQSTNRTLLRIITFLSIIAMVVILFIYRRQNSAVDPVPDKNQDDASATLQDAEADRFANQRNRMVSRQLAGRDITNQRVLDTMRSVPRHLFVSVTSQDAAYTDRPLPIGHRQTISQPYIVALMTQLVDPEPHHKALDVGTGSGYQAAVLSGLVDQVFSIEIVEPLAKQATARLKKLGYDNVQVRHGDGYMGWRSQAPFDVIIVAAAPDHIPPALIEQLAPGGRLIIPVGENYQMLKLVEKQPDGTISKQDIIPVMFVPMTGEAEE